jgi:hypothetical protein
MSNQPHPVSRFPSIRKLWKPAAITGAGGTPLVIDFIGVILLAILGGLICLFDNFVFKSRRSRREDFQDTINKGVKN